MTPNSVRSQYYSSAQTQLPLGDSIVVPTRNGIGTINLQTVGNDLKLDTDGPLKYFRQQLLSALGVPEGLLYGDTGNGGLINTSATKQDIRYLRTIQQFTSILSAGLISLFKDYLKMIGADISKIVVDVNFAQLNNEQDNERIEYEQNKLEALSRIIEGLASLGVTFEGGAYSKTREVLINRYLDSELLDAIQADEKNGDVGNPEEEPKDKPSGPRGGGFSPDIDMNIEGPSPEEGNEEELGEETPEGNDEIIDLDAGTEGTEEGPTVTGSLPPYS